jgi:hypothetical protein
MRREAPRHGGLCWKNREALCPRLPISQGEVSQAMGCQAVCGGAGRGCVQAAGVW